MIQRSDDGHDRVIFSDKSFHPYIFSTKSVCVHHSGLTLDSVTASHHHHSNRQNNKHVNKNNNRT